MTVSNDDLVALQSRINDKLANFNAMFHLTVHFSADRINDPRNVPPITILELEQVFEKLITNHMMAVVALNDGDTFNIRCLASHINMPCGVKKVTQANASITHKNIVITVMRKKFFRSKDPIEFQV